ncbi:uncharacterized protein METZ01_LOCUS248969, partial [marine metagenome]
TKSGGKQGRIPTWQTKFGKFK